MLGHSWEAPVWGWTFAHGAKTGLSRTKASHEVPTVRAPPSTQHTRRRQRGLSSPRSLLPTVFIKSHLQSMGRGMAGHCRASVRRHQGSPPTAAHRQATRDSGGEPTGSVHAPSVQLELSKELAASLCAQGWRTSPALRSVRQARGRPAPRTAAAQTAKRRQPSIPCALQALRLDWALV